MTRENEIYMEETVNQRIKKLTKSSKSMRAFAITVGIAPQQLDTLVNKESKPSFDTLVKILHAYPNVSADWLVLGIGDMYRNASGIATEKKDQDDKMEVAMLLERIKEKDDQLREKDKQIAWLMSHADDLRQMAMR